MIRHINQPKGLRRVSMLSLLCGVLITIGCTGYGEIEPMTYDFAKALYSITNRQAAEQLPAVSAQIAECIETGHLSKREATWLQAIIADAEQGDWTAANQECRQMMEDQINRKT